MVRRVLELLNKKISGLHEAAYLLAVFALLSHLLALIRDRMFAHFFGAGTTLDIYYASFRIPDFIFVSIASMVSLFVLIPFLLERIGDRKEAREFLSDVFSGFLFLILFVSVIVFFAAPQLLSLIFPGFDGAALDKIVVITRIMLLSPILLGISNIFASVTQSANKFFVYALSPVLYNVGIIFGVLVLYPAMGMPGLALGVVLGAFLHMIVQVPVVAHEKLLPRLTLRPNLKVLKNVAVTSLPRTFALASNQLVLLFLVAIASLMTEGSISVFNFAFNIQGVPLSIIAASYSVAAFPTLARLFTNGEKQKFFDHMGVAARHIIFWSMPAMVFFIVLRAQIIRVALGSGEFDWSDTRLTAAVLALFVVSLVAQSLEFLFIRGYYAAGKTKKPVVIKSITAVFIILLAFVLVRAFNSIDMFRYFIESLLDVDDIFGTSVLMLGISYSVGIILSAAIFWFRFNKDFGRVFPVRLLKTLGETFSGSVVGGVAAYGALATLGRVLNLDTFLGIFTQGFVSGLVGILVTALVLKMLGNRELYEVWESLHRKFWKSKPVGIEPEEL